MRLECESSSKPLHISAKKSEREGWDTNVPSSADIGGNVPLSADIGENLMWFNLAGGAAARRGVGGFAGGAPRGYGVLLLLHGYRFRANIAPLESFEGF